MVYSTTMPQIEKVVRQSVSIPERIARRVRGLAKTQKTRANRVLVDLIQAGLESKEAEKTRFFTIADQPSESPDAHEREGSKRGPARMTFGKECRRTTRRACR